MKKAFETDLLADGFALIEETLWNNVAGGGTSAQAPTMSSLIDDGSCGPGNYDRPCSFCGAQQDWKWRCGG